MLLFNSRPPRKGSIPHTSGPMKPFCSFKLIYLFLSEIETVQAGEGQRERGRERIPSGLHAVSTELEVGLKLMNREIMT